jgi:hypothetical protein
MSVTIEERKQDIWDKVVLDTIKHDYDSLIDKGYSIYDALLGVTKNFDGEVEMGIDEFPIVFIKGKFLLLISTGTIYKRSLHV